MKLERYELKAEKTFMIFEFISEGTNGRVTKLIQYSETNLKNFYNLGFGDKNPQTGDIDDKAITNNGDSKKVMATVAATVYLFLNNYPGAWIYATGSSKVRTRLYRIGITNNLNEILEDFDVYGLCMGEWKKFEKGIAYEAFLLKRNNV